MATRNGRGIFHGHDYAEANSISGDKDAARLNRWIDHDLQRARWRVVFFILIVTHWANPSREGFTYRGKKVTRDFRDIPLYRVLRMVSRGGFRIRTATQTMRDAKRLGVPGIEFELKFTPTQREMDRLAKAARKVFGDGWQHRVEIKMLQQFDWEIGLARASRAGFTTTLIRFTGNVDRLTRDYPFVDHYRR